MKNTTFSRRRFLGSIAAAAGTATPFALNLAAMANAAAAGASDYKALVCLFMTGGNDHYNTLLATDPDSWREYVRYRNTGNATSIALKPYGTVGGVLPIGARTTQPGRSFSLHPELGIIKGLFDAGRAAAVANVGTLITPLTKAEYLARSKRLPPKLFSHNDQQSMWQSCKPEGATFGWGGRMGDLLAANNGNASFTCVSTAGSAIYVAGRNVRQFQASSAGAVPIDGLNGKLYGSNNHNLRTLITQAEGNVIGTEYANMTARAIDLQTVLSGAMAAAGPGGIPNPPPYINPNTGSVGINDLAVQLQTVARMIAGRSTLGARRQVFFVNLGTFDTHDNQSTRHRDMLARLAHGIAYFDSILSNVMGSNMRDQVTTFTASDFGRALPSNGDGTDHGWGAHHFVIGGAVKGRDIYGAFPPIGLGHELDVGRGALLPTISVEQYGATLASWFGLSATQLTDVFPNLVNFSDRNLGFMS